MYAYGKYVFALQRERESEVNNVQVFSSMHLVNIFLFIKNIYLTIYIDAICKCKFDMHVCMFILFLFISLSFSRFAILSLLTHYMQSCLWLLLNIRVIAENIASNYFNYVFVFCVCEICV